MSINNIVISIVIPIYNAENYLHRCLDSIINNTYKELEIICVNDGSTDGSENIIAKYMADDERIKYVSKQNGGISSARNSGMKQATGDYLTFVDSDDWIHPRYFEMMVEAMNRNNSDLAMCGFMDTSDYSENMPMYSHEEISAETYHISMDTLFKDNKFRTYKVYVCGCLFRRNEMTYQFPENIKVIEDNIFNMLTLPKYKDVSIVNLPIYYYYQNPNSIMHTYTLEDAFSGLFWIINFVEKNAMDNCTKYDLVDFTYKRALFYRYAFSEIADKKQAQKITKECISTLKKYCNVLSLKKRTIYDICFLFPILYKSIKTMKDGKTIDERELFANAENKLITNK